MSRLENLLERWQDDVLSPREVEELLALLDLRDNRRALVEQLLFAQALRDLMPLAAPVPVSSPRPRRRLAVAALAAVLLLASLLMLAPRSAAARPVARVVEVAGRVEVVLPDGGSEPAVVGRSLFAGQRVRTGDEESFAVLEYPDATRLELHASTQIRLADVGRKVELTGGVLRADVPQRTQTPMVVAVPGADVRTSGGQMLLASPTGEATRVDLETGHAELVSADGSATEMDGGQSLLQSDGETRTVLQSRVLTRPSRWFDFKNARAATYADDRAVLFAQGRFVRCVGLGTAARNCDLAPRKEAPIDFDSDGQMFAIGGLGRVAVWTTQPFGLVRQFDVPAGCSFALAGELAIIDPRKSVAAFHDVLTGELRRTIPLGRRTPRLPTLSADGRRLAVAALGPSRAVLVVDADNGEKLAEFTDPRAPLRCLTFSADGTILAGADTAGVVYLWDIQTRTLLRRLDRHQRGILALAFSPDGRQLAGGAVDGGAWVWRTGTGEQDLFIQAGQRGVRGLAFSRDGRRLLTCGLAMPVREWDLPQE